MAAAFKLEIVTPETNAFSGDVEMVQLTGIDGEMGILAGHMPLMTQLAAGEILVKQAGSTIHLAVGEGFVQVTTDSVSILTDMAINADQIDEAKAEEALKKAEERRSQKLTEEESAAVESSVIRATAQLKVKRSQRR